MRPTDLDAAAYLRGCGPFWLSLFLLWWVQLRDNRLFLFGARLRGLTVFGVQMEPCKSSWLRRKQLISFRGLLRAEGSSRRGSINKAHLTYGNLIRSR